MTPRPRPRAAFIAVNTLLVWLTTGVAAAAFWPIYQDPQLVLLVSVTILLGSAVAILGAVFRWPSYVVVLAGFTTFLLAGVPLAVPGRALFGVFPTLDGLIELVGSIALGWKRLLTITLPVGSYQSLLVPLFLLVLSTTIIALSIALRAKWGEFGVVAPILLFVAGIAFGPATTQWPIALALAMLATSLLWLVWRRWFRRRESIRSLAAGQAEGAQTPDGGRERVPALRPIIAGVLILGVASVSSIAAAQALPPQGSRDVLRTAIVQPFDPRDYPSPLAGFRRYLRDDRVDEVMLRVTGLPEGARIRIATLDSYDGIVYAVGSAEVDSASGTFVRIPSAVDQTGVLGASLRLEVEVEGYEGVWVPTVGALESIRFVGDTASPLEDGFFYNGTSGTGAELRGLTRGDSYVLNSVLERTPAEAALSEATPGSAPVPRSDVLPDGVAQKVDDYVGDAESPGAQLLAVIEGLRREGYISHGLSPEEPLSRSGHAADRVTELLTAPRMIGDAEQYAVAAAIMVRQLGFPARVVMGFAPTVTGAGETVVRGSDVTAWIEVNTSRAGLGCRRSGAPGAPDPRGAAAGSAADLPPGVDRAPAAGPQRSSRGAGDTRQHPGQPGRARPGDRRAARRVPRDRLGGARRGSRGGPLPAHHRREGEAATAASQRTDADRADPGRLGRVRRLDGRPRLRRARRRHEVGARQFRRHPAGARTRGRRRPLGVRPRRAASCRRRPCLERRRRPAGRPRHRQDAAGSLLVDGVAEIARRRRREEAVRPMNCRYCGTRLPTGAMFCGECGRSVAAAVAPTAVTPLLPSPAPSPTAAAAPTFSHPDSAAPASDPAPAFPTGTLSHCAQCGSPMEPGDIFCGECGFVARTVMPPASGENDTVAVTADPEILFAEFARSAPRGEDAPRMADADVDEVAEAEADALADADAEEPVEAPAEPSVTPALAPAFTHAAEPSAERYVLQFSTGESVTVQATGLIGRNPSTEPGEYVDDLVAILDEGKSVSKTHLEFGQDEGRLWVSDRYSTNGTILRAPRTEPRRCEPGHRYVLDRGWRVDIGDEFFVVI